MSKVFNVRRAEGWDRSNLMELVNSLKDLPMYHAATVTVKGSANSDLSSVISVFRVPDGWVINSPAKIEPSWVTLLRESLVSGKDPIDEINF